MPILPLPPTLRRLERFVINDLPAKDSAEHTRKGVFLALGRLLIGRLDGDFEQNSNGFHKKIQAILRDAQRSSFAEIKASKALKAVHRLSGGAGRSPTQSEAGLQKRVTDVERANKAVGVLLANETSPLLRSLWGSVRVDMMAQLAIAHLDAKSHDRVEECVAVGRGIIHENAHSIGTAKELIFHWIELANCAADPSLGPGDLKRRRVLFDEEDLPACLHSFERPSSESDGAYCSALNRTLSENLGGASIVGQIGSMRNVAHRETLLALGPGFGNRAFLELTAFARGQDADLDQCERWYGMSFDCLAESETMASEDTHRKVPERGWESGFARASGWGERARRSAIAGLGFLALVHQLRGEDAKRRDVVGTLQALSEATPDVGSTLLLAREEAARLDLGAQWDTACAELSDV